MVGWLLVMIDGSYYKKYKKTFCRRPCPADQNIDDSTYIYMSSSNSLRRLMLFFELVKNLSSATSIRCCSMQRFKLTSVFYSGDCISNDVSSMFVGNYVGIENLIFCYQQVFADQVFCSYTVEGSSFPCCKLLWIIEALSCRVEDFLISISYLFSRDLYRFFTICSVRWPPIEREISDHFFPLVLTFYIRIRSS